MATLAVALLSRAGVDMTGVTPTATTGDVFPNTGAELIEINNASGGSINVTPHLTATLDGQTATDKVIAVPAGKVKTIGPFPPGKYNDVDGNCKVTCSSVTTVTIRVLKQVINQ